jgi:hypothetical protein
MSLWDWMLNVCDVKINSRTREYVLPCPSGTQKYLLIRDNKKYAAEDFKSTGSEFTWLFFNYIVYKLLTAVLCYCVCCALLQRGVSLTSASRK